MYDTHMKEDAHLNARSRIARWGSSLAVRIPKQVAEQWGVQEGSAIVIVPSSDKVVLRKGSPDLVDLLAQVTPHNLHAEWDTGYPQGREEQ